MTQYESQYERMIKQPIPSLILTLALPTTISMLVTNIYNMADTYFVSTVGTSATGAVGIVFGLMAILQAFGFDCDTRSYILKSTYVFDGLYFNYPTLCKSLCLLYFDCSTCYDFIMCDE